MNEVMIDIETLSTKHDAVVLSVGAVKFDQSGPSELEHLILTLDLREQLGWMGRRVDQDTLLWWMGQGEAARGLAFSKDRRDVRSAMGVFIGFVEGAEQVWANSPSFDLIILETLLNRLDMRVPWSHRSARDVRTIREAAGIDRNWAPDGWSGIEHDPVSDCLWQIEVVRASRRILGIVS